MVTRKRAHLYKEIYIKGELDIVVEFAVDSLLEEAEFELPVPRAISLRFRGEIGVRK